MTSWTEAEVNRSRKQAAANAWRDAAAMAEDGRRSAGGGGGSCGNRSGGSGGSSGCYKERDAVGFKGSGSGYSEVK